MAKLKALAGCLACSFGGLTYSVDENGIVDVPDEAIAELLPHGFIVVPPIEFSIEEREKMVSDADAAHAARLEAEKTEAAKPAVVLTPRVPPLLAPSPKTGESDQQDAPKTDESGPSGESDQQDAPKTE